MSSIIRATTTSGLQIAPDNSGSLQLQTNGTTTAVTIDTSQNVGIGTSSPYAKQQVYQSSQTLPVNWVYRATQTAGSVIPTTFGYPYLQVGGAEYASSGTAIQSIGFGYISANGNFPPAEIGLATTSTAGQTYGDLVFATRSALTNTQATERMRIDSSGNVLVGTTSPISSGKQTISFNGVSFNGLIVSESANTSNAAFIGFNNGATNIGSISRVGATSAVVYSTTSDERLKSNIVNSNSVLDKLMQVQVRQYDWTEGNVHQEYGFIAQELEPVLSGIVTKGKTDDDMWQLDYSRLTPHLVKAIQEQQTIINDLKARIETLEAK